MEAAKKQLLSALHSGDPKAFADGLGLASRTITGFRPESCSHQKTGDSLLHVACRLGRVGELSQLLGAFPDLDLNVQNFEGKTPLHEAAQFCQPEAAAWLLGREAAVDPLKRADWTPLMLACTKRGNLAVVSELLAAGADPTLTNKDGWTAFHLSSREGDVEIMETLLEHSPGLWEGRSKNGRTPLHTAALAADSGSMKWLLSRCPFPPDQADSCGSTPLMDCARAGSVECVRILAGYGHSPLAQDLMGRNSLHVAAHSGKVEVIRCLLGEFSLPVGSTSTGGMTALHWAALEGQVGSLRVLVEAGGDVSVADDRGRVALGIAQASRHEAAADFLQSLTA